MNKIPVWLDKWDKEIRKDKCWYFCFFIWNKLTFVALASYNILYYDNFKIILRFWEFTETTV